MRTLERFVDRIWHLGLDFDEQTLQDKAVRFNFLLWDHTAFGVGMGCLECDESVFVLLNYTSTSDGTLRLFRGEAWTSDASQPGKNQRKADMGTAMRFLGARVAGTLFPNQTFKTPEKNTDHKRTRGIWILSQDMIAPTSSFASSLSAISARGLTSLSMSAGAGEYKPWDVKQEGGQMDSGWGGGGRRDDLIGI